MTKRGMSQEKIEKVRELRSQGKSVRETAAAVGVSRGTVVKYGGDTTKKVVDPTNREIQRLQGTILQMQGDRKHLLAQLKTAQKSAATFHAIQSELAEICTPMSPLPKAKPVRGSKVRKVRETCVLHLSDGHHDAEIFPEQTGGLETYNFWVSCARAEMLVDSILDYTRDGDFRQLVILMNGDHTNGEIHNADSRSTFRNTFRNCWAISQLHSLMIRDLARHFPDVKVIYTVGNHGRRREVRRKDYKNPTDSWDYLIGLNVQLLMRGHDNVNVVVPPSFSTMVSIEGHNFMVFHGDDIKSWAGIPWYGIQRKTSKLAALHGQVANEKINYFCMGHFHNMAMQADLGGERLVNGAWPATCPYAYNSLSTYSNPLQLFHGVHPKYGVTWRLPIHLKHDLEIRGPQRYAIELADIESGNLTSMNFADPNRYTT